MPCVLSSYVISIMYRREHNTVKLDNVLNFALRRSLFSKKIPEIFTTCSLICSEQKFMKTLGVSVVNLKLRIY